MPRISGSFRSGITKHLRFYKLFVYSEAEFIQALHWQRLTSSRPKVWGFVTGELLWSIGWRQLSKHFFAHA
jgi:hypothetical protein